MPPPPAIQYDPQLVIISAGFDAAMGDPLGGQKITPVGYAHLTHRLTELARGKVVLVLEGGYKYARRHSPCPGDRFVPSRSS